MLACLCCAPLPALEGMRFVGIGPEQQATAGAGAASPRDSTWIALNPAGLTRITERVDFSLDLLWADIGLQPDGVLANPAVGDMHDEVFLVAPSLSAAWRPAGIDGTVGTALYAVAGQEVGFDRSRSSLGAASDFDRRAEYQVLRWANAYAADLGDGLSLGVSLDVDYARFRSDALTAGLTQTAGGYRWDSALGVGFEVGLLKTIKTGHAFALVYHSRHWMQHLDRYRDLLIGPIDQPQVVQLGTAWRLGRRVELLVDYRFIDWSSVRVLGDESAGFGWQDQHIFKLALHLAASDALDLHAGLSYGRSAVPDSHAFTNGLSQLVNRWHVAGGATWQVGGGFDTALAVIHSPHHSVTDDGSRLGGTFADTEISLTTTEVTMGVGYRF